MKRALSLICLCVLGSSFASSYANTTDATTTTVKSKKRVYHRSVMKDQASTPIYKDEPVKPAEKYPWMDNLSGNLAFVSNYVFRGITQTKNLPAIQGGLTYSFPIGIYLNAWGSNVKFDDDSNATLELDSIIGYHNTIGENFTYDLNAARYNYPGARELNYNELNTLFNYRFLQAGLSYSANVYNTHQTGTYYSGGINWGIPPQYAFNIEDLTLIALLGHYSLPAAAGPSYNDYNVSLSKKIRNYTLIGQWTSTNGRQHISPYDGSQLIGQIVANF